MGKMTKSPNIVTKSMGLHKNYRVRSRKKSDAGR